MLLQNAISIDDKYDKQQKAQTKPKNDKQIRNQKPNKPKRVY